MLVMTRHSSPAQHLALQIALGRRSLFLVLHLVESVASSQTSEYVHQTLAGRASSGRTGVAAVELEHLRGSLGVVSDLAGHDSEAGAGCTLALALRTVPNPAFHWAQRLAAGDRGAAVAQEAL